MGGGYKSTSPDTAVPTQAKASKAKTMSPLASARTQMTFRPSRPSSKPNCTSLLHTLAHCTKILTRRIRTAILVAKNDTYDADRLHATSLATGELLKETLNVASEN